jgi:hypothetical protein
MSIKASAKWLSLGFPAILMTFILYRAWTWLEAKIHENKSRGHTYSASTSSASIADEVDEDLAEELEEAGPRNQIYPAEVNAKKKPNDPETQRGGTEKDRGAKNNQKFKTTTMAVQRALSLPVFHSPKWAFDEEMEVQADGPPRDSGHNPSKPLFKKVREGSA